MKTALRDWLLRPIAWLTILATLPVWVLADYAKDTTRQTFENVRSWAIIGGLFAAGLLDIFFCG
jgi:hypothetical protein